MRRRLAAVSDSLRRLLGAALGGAIGYGAFLLIEAQEYRALAVVGACLAIGAGLGATRRRLGWGVIIAVLAVVVTILVEWHHYPFRSDESLTYFVTHIASVSTNSKITYAAVAAAGLWFGMGRNRRPRPD